MAVTTWTNLLTRFQKVVDVIANPSQDIPKFKNLGEYRAAMATCLVENKGAPCSPAVLSAYQLFPAKLTPAQFHDVDGYSFKRAGEDYRMICDSGHCFVQRWVESPSNGFPILAGCANTPEKTATEDVGSFKDSSADAKVDVFSFPYSTGCDPKVPTWVKLFKQNAPTTISAVAPAPSGGYLLVHEFSKETYLWVENDSYSKAVMYKSSSDSPWSNELPEIPKPNRVYVSRYVAKSGYLLGGGAGKQQKSFLMLLSESGKGIWNNSSFSSPSILGLSNYVNSIAVSPNGSMCVIEFDSAPKEMHPKLVLSKVTIWDTLKGTQLGDISAKLHSMIHWVFDVRANEDKFVASGNIFLNSNGPTSNGVVVQFDSGGSIDWQVQYTHYTAKSTILGVVPIVEGGVLAVGWGNHSFEGGSPVKFFSSRVDASGKKLWDKVLDFQIDYGFALSPMYNGNVVVGGPVKGDILSASDDGLLLAIINPNSGAVDSLRKYSAIGYRTPTMAATFDGGLIVSGGAREELGPTFGIAIKTDPTGNVCGKGNLP